MNKKLKRNPLKLKKNEFKELFYNRIFSYFPDEYNQKRVNV